MRSNFEKSSYDIRKKDKKEQLLQELISNLPNPIHKRLIEAYESESPLRSMESELGKILLEIYNED